uniref:Picornavirus capsid domain-containing protein n=1 Tax=Pericapritermes dicistro-like virus 2 TaxID=3032224 RepID=A0AAT9JFP9_9VIRU
MKAITSAKNKATAKMASSKNSINSTKAGLKNIGDKASAAHSRAVDAKDSMVTKANKYGTKASDLYDTANSMFESGRAKYESLKQKASEFKETLKKDAGNGAVLGATNEPDVSAMEAEGVEIPAPNFDLPMEEGANGMETIDTLQQEDPVEESVMNQEIVEHPGDTNVRMFESPINDNYHLDSIKTWLTRQHLVSTAQPLASAGVALNNNLLRKIAKGKLDYFRYFRCDFDVILRWNVPKTVYGTFVLMFDYVSNTLNLQPPNVDFNANPIKILCDLNSGEARIKIPYFYPTSVWDLSETFCLGGVSASYLFGPQSVTDTLITPSFNTYVTCTNITVSTPFPASLFPQGNAITKGLQIGGMDGWMDRTPYGFKFPKVEEESPTVDYQAHGNQVIRTFVEGLNLTRQDGFDPAIPTGRVQLPVKPIPDDATFSDYHQLCAIPSYEVIANSSAGYETVLLYPHYWLDFVRQFHPMVRCDFTVTLRVVCSSFHTGRVRIVYVPRSDGTTLVQTGDPQAMAYAPSILWDIQDESQITFEVPYGNVLDFNRFPGIIIYHEVPFVSAFGASAPVGLVMTTTCSNVSVLGYHHATIPYKRFPRWSSLPSSQTPLTVSQSLGVLGFYSPTHSSDDETNTSISTTCRRPTEYATIVFDNTTSEKFLSPYYDLLTSNPTATGVSYRGSYLAHFLCRFAGWRGSLKVSLVCKNTDARFRVRIQFPESNGDQGELWSELNYFEFTLPYMCRYTFVSGTYISAYPSFFVELLGVDLTTVGTPVTMFLSTLADFTPLMPARPLAIPTTSSQASDV